MLSFVKKTNFEIVPFRIYDSHLLKARDHLPIILHKYYISSLIIVQILILVACNSEPDYFSDTVWYIREYDIDDNNELELKERIFIKNDSVYSFSFVDKKDFVCPLTRVDDQLIIKRIFPLDYNGQSVTKDTLIIDTVYFEFKKILDKQVLLLTKKESNYLIVLRPDKNVKNIIETSKYLKVNDFKIAGISIGDTLDPKELNFVDDKYYGIEKNLLVATLKVDNNIKLELVEKYIVYGIKQERIAKESITGIIGVVNKKLGVLPDTIKMKEDNYTEGYKWEMADISIELTRTELSNYYVDLAKKTEDYGVKRIFAQLAIAQIDDDKYWTLSYDNKLFQEVLQLYSNKSPVSNIIE